MSEAHKHSVKPEAGSGLCYSLALFLTHQADFRYVLAEVEILAAEGAIQFDGHRTAQPAEIRRTIERLAATRWFSAAAMPLRNLQIPNSIPSELRDRIGRHKDRCLRWMVPHSPARGGPTATDVKWSIDEAKEIVRLIDEHHGIHTISEHVDVLRREPVLRFRDQESDASHAP